MSDTKIDRLNEINFYTMLPNKKIKRVFKAFYESEYRRPGSSGALGSRVA
jgi:hypothetical protein